MSNEKPRTINEEAGLPDNWVPIDTTPVTPRSSEFPGYPTEGGSKFLQGTLPPGYQHDTSFVGTAYRPSIPQLSMMPLGPQGNPSTNAAAQSTATQVAQQIVAADVVPDIESIAINKQTGASYTVQSGDRNTLISLSNNAGGTVILPGPTGTFAFIQAVGFNGGHSASTTITNIQGGMLFMQVDTSDSGALPPTVADTNGNVWVKITSVFNGGSTSVSYWYATNINGGSNTITVTNASGSVYCIAVLAEYSGPTPSSPVDQFTTQIEPGGNQIVTGTANELVIFSSSVVGGSTAPTYGTGWTGRITTGVGINQVIEDKIVATSGSIIQNSNNLNSFPAGPQIFATLSFKLQTPQPAVQFPAGWFTYLENTGTGTFTVISSAQIDNVVQTIPIPPNQGLLIVFDGVNWFTERGLSPTVFYQTVQQATVSKPQESKLNFLAPITATDNSGNKSTDIAVPVFIASGASHAIGLVPDPGVSAGTAKFLREDATWAGISAIGGVSTFTGSYTALGTDNGKLLSFAVGAPVSPAFVQYKTASGGVVNSLASPAITLTAGNFVVVEMVVGNLNEQVVNTITDTLGNVYTRIPSSHSFTTNVFSGSATECWYAQNVTGGATTITASWTQAGGFSQIKVSEYSGVVKTVNPVDAVVTGTGNGNPALSLTTTTEDALVVGAFEIVTAQTYNNMTSRAGAVLDLGDTEISPNAVFTVSTAGAGAFWVGNLVAFQAGPSGGDVLKLPAVAPSASWIIFVQNTGTNPLFISGNSRTIDGSSTNLPLFGGQGLVIFSDGTNYFTSRGMQASPVFVARSLLTLQSAAITATTSYAIPVYGAGMYRISYEASVTRVATTSSSLGGTNGFQVKFTNANGDTVVKTSNPTAPPVSAGNTTGTTISGSLLAYCGAGTNLQYLFDYTSVGGTTMQYDLAVYVEYLGL